MNNFNKIWETIFLLLYWVATVSWLTDWSIYLLIDYLKD